MISTWKRKAIANMASGFERGKSEDKQQSEAEIKMLHSQIGRLGIHLTLCNKTLRRSHASSAERILRGVVFPVEAVDILRRTRHPLHRADPLAAAPDLAPGLGADIARGQI